MLTTHFIDAYIDDLRRTSANILEINGRGFRAEAIVLVCTFIESLGKDVTQLAKPTHNFCYALINLSGERFWSVIHPGRLEQQLGTLKHPPPRGLFLLQQFYDATAVQQTISAALGVQVLSPAHQKAIDSSTVAACVYGRLRSEQVHNYSSGLGNLSFSAHAFDGAPAPEIEFEFLHRSADAIVNWMDRNRPQVGLFQ